MEQVLTVCASDGTQHIFSDECIVEAGLVSGSYRVMYRGNGSEWQCCAEFNGVSWYKYDSPEPSFHILPNVFYEQKKSNAWLRIGVGMLLAACIGLAYFIKTQAG